MSSLAATRADGYYYGSGYDPKKHKSLNKYRKSHPLGIRAKDIKNGIILIRFEMPFKVWCLKCNQIIDKGVRFDARKKCIGKYFSTNIWQFTMNCHVCQNELSLTTDPKNTEYICTSGIRQKIEDSSKSRTTDLNENLTTISKEMPACNEVKLTEKLQSRRYGDNFLTNSILRKESRINRKSKPNIEKNEPRGNLALNYKDIRLFRGEHERQRARATANKNRSKALKSSIF